MAGLLIDLRIQILTKGRFAVKLIPRAQKIKVELNWYGKVETAFVLGGKWHSENKDLQHALSLIVLTPGHHPDIDHYLADSAVAAFGGKVYDTRTKPKIKPMK